MRKMLKSLEIHRILIFYEYISRKVILSYKTKYVIEKFIKTYHTEQLLNSFVLNGSQIDMF